LKALREANRAARWKMPLNMAAFGVGLMVIIELTSYAIRRKPVETPVVLDSQPEKPAETK
jgi:hypothetical protein